MSEETDLTQRITARWISRAERLEDYWRDFAFLGLNDEIRTAGRHTVEVRQLTLRMFVQLCAVRSPFLVGGHVGPEHVAQILWRLSPAYDARATDPEARKKFVATILHLPFELSVRAIKRYLDRMLIDKPPQSTAKNGTRPDTSFAASAIHQLASEYGWSDESILDLPIPRLFQYMRKIQRSRDFDMAHFNPLRDRFVKYISDKVMEARKQSHNGEC